ncbi:MAG: hypothetical protein SGI84_13160 [Gemmatimonadota bacterium]|nr:hypothetical protein [Gemmatimonadota bacterium]
MDLRHAGYEPWVGESFGAATELGSKRLLLVGESHYLYADEMRYDTPDLTRGVVDDIRTGRQSYPFFTKIRGLVTAAGGLPELSLQEFWDSVAFINFVPHSLVERGDRPSEELWQAASDRFVPGVLDVEPHRVLVVAKGVWDRIRFPKEWTSTPSPAFGVEHIRDWQSPSGTPIRATWTRHPQYQRGWSQEEWLPRVEALLQE